MKAEVTGRHGGWRKARFLGAVVLALGVLLAVGTAAAQGGEELRAYLDRTDELLEWAADQVAASDSDQARRVLEHARQLQSRSRDLLARQRPLEAFSAGRRARDAMWHAVRLSREAAGLDERLRLRSERFADQHSQLADRARESGSQRAVNLLERAAEHARRAGEREAQGDLQMAMKLLEQAEDLLRMAARVLAEGVGPERMERELERTRQIVDEAGDRLSGDGIAPGALESLAEARDALARAVGAASSDAGQALQLSTLARRLARRALSEVETQPDAGAVERLLARFDERATDLAAQIRDSGSSQAARAFEQARQQRDLAAISLRDGDPAKALRQARSAHELLDKAGRGLR